MNLNRYIISLFFGVMLASQVVMTGCAARVGVGYDYYDPYYHDRHHWDDGEARFYSQWTVETHRPPDRDFSRMNKREQGEYWKWRHDHK